jgi:hypothetical protein
VTYTEAMIALAEMLSCGSDDPRLRVVANEMGNLGARLAESEARLVSCNQAAEENASIARSYLGRAEAAEAERDDLLGALREIGALLYAQALYGTEGHAKVVEAHSRARAAIAKVGGP